MQQRRFILGIVIGLLCVPSAAWAILIEAGGVPVGGYFQSESDDGKILTIKVRSADGTEKIREFERAKIKIIHPQPDRQRLEKLSKDNPKGYGDYAAELAVRKDDPEAKDMAMRLYLIAAYLKPEQFGHSSLVSMSALASTAAEERRCRAMAFLLDPRGDAALLKKDAGKPREIPKGQAGAMRDFVKALHLYRAGKVKEAMGAARGEGVENIFGAAPGMMDQKSFLKRCTEATCTTCKLSGKVKCTMCNGKKKTRNMFGQMVLCTECNGTGVVPCPTCDGLGINPISEDVLRIVLRAELWAVNRLAGEKKATGKASWSSILEARQVSPVLPLSWETITEFDPPSRCHYRNGKWVAP